MFSYAVDLQHSVYDHHDDDRYKYYFRALHPNSALMGQINMVLLEMGGREVREKLGVEKTLQNSVSVVPLGSNVQLSPPSVVYIMVPFSPTMMQ